MRVVVEPSSYWCRCLFFMTSQLTGLESLNNLLTSLTWLSLRKLLFTANFLSAKMSKDVREIIVYHTTFAIKNIKKKMKLPGVSFPFPRFLPFLEPEKPVSEKPRLRGHEAPPQGRQLLLRGVEVPLGLGEAPSAVALELLVELRLGLLGGEVVSLEVMVFFGVSR